MRLPFNRAYLALPLRIFLAYAAGDACNIGEHLRLNMLRSSYACNTEAASPAAAQRGSSSLTSLQLLLTDHGYLVLF